MSHRHMHRFQPDGSPCGCATEYRENTYFTSIEHITYWPRQEEARELLEQVAARVGPVMKRLGWTRVARLAEFYPDKEGLYAINMPSAEKGKGRIEAVGGSFDTGCQVFVCLRRNDDKDRFLPLGDITDSFLHELCHGAVAAHDAEFLALFQHVKGMYVELEGELYADCPTEMSFIDQGFKVDMPPRNTSSRGCRSHLDGRRQQGSRGISHTAPSTNEDCHVQ